MKTGECFNVGVQVLFPFTFEKEVGLTIVKLWLDDVIVGFIEDLFALDEASAPAALLPKPPALLTVEMFLLSPPWEISVACTSLVWPRSASPVIHHHALRVLVGRQKAP